MLEISLWHQGLIVWQLALIEATLPVVKFMQLMMKSWPDTSEAESVGSALFISDEQPELSSPFHEGSGSMQIDDKEVRTMPCGTVRWFNRKTGAGFIRTDDGENVLFLNGDIRDPNPNSIHSGARVRLDVLKSKYGLTGINVRAVDLQAGGSK